MRFKTLLRAGMPALSLMAALGLTQPAQTAGMHPGGHGHGGDHMASKPDIGEPGKASQATRTIEIVMHENYFEPEKVSAKAGETIRFKIRNAGELVHEFNLGTAAMHAEHQDEMAMMVDHGVLGVDKVHWDMMGKDMGGGHVMTHDHPNSILLEPGKSGEVVWTFPEETALEFACNVPGHYASGMVGTIKLGK